MTEDTPVAVDPDPPTPPFWKMAIPGVALGILAVLCMNYLDRFIDIGGGEQVTALYYTLAAGGFIIGWFAPFSGIGLIVWTFASFSIGSGMFAGGENPFLVLAVIIVGPAFVLEWMAWMLGAWLRRRSGAESHWLTPKAGIALLVVVVLAVPALALWERRHDVSGDFPQHDDPTQLWRRQLSTAPRTWTVAIGERHGGPVAIAGAVFASAKGVLYCIDHTGAERWRLADVTTEPLISEDQNLYVGVSSGLARVDPATGDVLWIAKVGPIEARAAVGDRPSGLAVGPSGTIYVNPKQHRTIAAINPDGSIRWQLNDSGTFVGAPVEGPSGHVYVAHHAGDHRKLSVRALDAGGNQLWRTPLRGDGHAVAVGADDTVYATAAEYLYALSSAGSIKWRRQLHQRVYDVTVDHRGRVLANAYGWWYAMDAEGRALFGPLLGGRPAFAGDVIVFATHELHAYKSHGETEFFAELIWSSDVYNANETAVGPDGMLYVQLQGALVGMRLPTPPYSFKQRP